jgi:hypothetical protein
MKLFNFITACVFCLLMASCSGNKEKESVTTNTDTAITTESPVTNSIVTTPQLMLVAKHKVRDFAKWKTSFDAHDSLRLAHGIHDYVIGRSAEDSNNILVAFKIDDAEKAKAFSKSNELKAALKDGGVLNPPKVTMINMIWQDTSIIGSVLRSETSFSVKEWNTWRANFESANQERLENGITTRAFGHDVDDNTKVVLVTALLDTAKARAYWNSDMLKKRREAGGVMSEPERFVFHVVHRY